MDTFKVGDQVIWNKLMHGKEELFPTEITIDKYGEGPFTVIEVSAVTNPTAVKTTGHPQWLKIEGHHYEWSGKYFIKITKSHQDVWRAMHSSRS